MLDKSLCIALDVPEPFGRNATELIHDTKDFAGFYKVSPAFLRFNTIRRVIDEIRKQTEAFIILDGKYGDVYHTNQRYAQYAYENLEVDAVTLNPFVGLRPLLPFFAYDNKQSFIWVASSAKDTDSISMELVNNAFPNSGMIIGAIHLGLLNEASSYDVPILVPGIGKQGGHLKDVAGYPNVIPVLGRSIIEADNRYDLLAEVEEVIWNARNKYAKSSG